jgi:hypothetical protein
MRCTKNLESQFVTSAKALDLLINPRLNEVGMKNDMALPENKTCSDCVHCNRCTKIFGVVATNKECDFSPSRFIDNQPKATGE